MTQTSRQVISASWGLLEALDTASEGQQSRTLPDFQTAHGSVMLSRDSEGTRHVLVPVAASESVRPDTQSRGVQLVHSSFIDQGVRRYFVDIRCPEPRLHRVFDQIAASMLEALVSTPEQPAGQVCAAVLESWRALLRRASKPLGATALRGLFGELWYLAQLCEDDPVAVEHWCGPDEQPQDFISTHGAFEVKTASRNPARRVTVSSVDQLDDAAHSFLVLVVISATEDPRGTTIPELVERIVAAGSERERVLDRLAKAGVQEADLPGTAKLHLRVTNHVAYQVNDDFPRLTPRSFAPAFPAGIPNLRYEVDLGAASACVISDKELHSLQRQFLGRE